MIDHGAPGAAAAQVVQPSRQNVGPSPVGLWARRLLRWTIGALLLLWFAFAGATLLLRYWILPDADRYRPDLERFVSQSIGLGVHIGKLTGGWDGLRPEVELAEVRIADPKGRTVLAFARVQAVLSWRSLVLREPTLHRLSIEAPALHVQRDVAGKIFVAGLPIDEATTTDTPLGDWILRQHEIVISNALLVWEDAKRAAPPLFLERLNLRLENSGDRHRFGLSGRPNANLAQGLDLRGDLRGRNIKRLGEWHGELYAEAEAVDMAGWRAWIDYPVALPTGHGGLRVWLDFADGMPTELTADVALRDVRARLSPKLPQLDVVDMRGRIAAQRRGEGLGAFSVVARQLSLETRDGIRVEPIDFSLDWAAEKDGMVRGKVAINALDLGVLARLAKSLPLDAKSRGLLADFAPLGRIGELKASWHGNAEAAREYSLKASFDGLGARAKGVFPGFSGLNGSVEANQNEGRVVLRSGASAIELPAVFPQSRTVFDSLSATIKWTRKDGELNADLEQASFSGPDASGSAQGHYRRQAGSTGPGEIDLAARLERADGRAVWRYMPHVVSPSARNWVKRGIVAGSASDVRLTLKGNLDRFPFRNPKDGQFLVTAKAAGTVIDYAPGWPRIDRVRGELRFEGARMRVDAEAGEILGTQLSATTVEIPDLQYGDPKLLVKGIVVGPTTEFLKFIEKSPVSERVGHFTEDVLAVGSGKLNLSLSIPLNHLDATLVQGDYQFIGNQITVVPGLPPISQVNGRLGFSGNEISARDIGGVFLGAPVKISASTPDDHVLVNARGSVSVAEAKRLYDWPIFDHLAGSSPFGVEVLVRKKQADVTVEASLQGVSSSLPAPFNKVATDVLPLRVENSRLPAETGSDGKQKRPAREQWKVALGKVAAAQLMRHTDAGSGGLVHGAVAIGEPLRLPEKGLAVAITAPRVDFDFWRKQLPGDKADGKPGNFEALPMPSLSLKTPQLVAMGRDWHDVEFRSSLTPDGVFGHVQAREVVGDWLWQEGGKGKLRARLKHLVLHSVEAVQKEEVSEVLESLPALDIVAEQFALGSRQLGRLELVANNLSRVWRIDRLAIANPDGQLSAYGRWRFGAPQRTRLDFTVEAGDVGKLLGRFGLPDAVRRGSANVAGKLEWQGGPAAIDYPSLAGELKLTAARGQFAKLEPGIGKLLSLLSLQNLPRRIGLDFRDVFSEGFAFDTIGGEFDVANGIMHTEELKVEGPTAKVLMRGDIDLGNETQDLRVAIQPELGGTVALGAAAAVNPIAGVAALLLQRLLQDPLNKAFAFEYAVTGPWAEPKVEKVAEVLPTREKVDDTSKP